MMLTYMLANPSFINNEVPVMLAYPFFIKRKIMKLNWRSVLYIYQV